MVQMHWQKGLSTAFHNKTTSPRDGSKSLNIRSFCNSGKSQGLGSHSFPGIMSSNSGRNKVSRRSSGSRYLEE